MINFTATKLRQNYKMKKILKIVFPILLLIIISNKVEAQSFDAKLSLILYDSFPDILILLLIMITMEEDTVSQCRATITN